MKIYLVLYQIASDMFGYHDTFLAEDAAVEESKRMNESEKGKYYHYFVKVKRMGDK
ncbi:hypothetical protein BH780_gp047 [Bacillus phage Eldridge]|uniref:Uncharacterized protein n=1 Tax=Bacillus phage Eldridge TaxID=1776293 RepID=A0A0Y0C515_9CAUD|nr:hypothetical protein BH780_gp047 [Bacillus phage Eldridge]AMB18630.1 hypothetical protein Eldridge_047 [Bacillus phage Eldridge]